MAGGLLLNPKSFESAFRRWFGGLVPAVEDAATVRKNSDADNRSRLKHVVLSLL